MAKEVDGILREDERRRKEEAATFDPITGEGSTGKRFRFVLDDFIIKEQWLPVEMKESLFIRRLQRAGSIKKYLLRRYGEAYYETAGQMVIDKAAIADTLVRLRIKHDFPFWAATFIWIKNKGGGADVLFRLTRPQRKLVARLESMRLAGKPIRLVLLKARQWGGSTTIQLYMMWLQTVHEVGLNSLIIAHKSDATAEVKAMFVRAIREYPVRLLHDVHDDWTEREPKLVGEGRSGNIYRVPQRKCTIKMGTAESPDTCRGGDYNLVHLSEVGLWKRTEGKTPEDIVRSACAGVLLAALTMIVYESTANGTGNFFHTEYLAAKDGTSAFMALFISWFEIELYRLAFKDDAERRAFATELYENRESESRADTRHTTGRYLWWLWEQGATLEAINWYIQMRATFNDDAQMHAEYPTDDIEAFVHSGSMVFDKYRVEALRPSCMPPQHIGDVYADGDTGKAALTNVRFKDDGQGLLWVWDMPERDAKEKVLRRYLVVVDIGGRSASADWSVIVVFDRLFMMDGDKPMVVAQWYGHIDMDLLAWKAAQIAAWYDDALLVIESNTLETHDREREVDGDQSHFILNQIKNYYSNLYARRQSEEDIRQGAPKKYGFHTNIATKPMIISTLVKVVRERLYIERDSRCIDEMLTYERRQNGSYGAIIGRHDDLLMTRAIGLHICYFEMDLPKIVIRGDDLKAIRKQHRGSMTEARIG